MNVSILRWRSDGAPFYFNFGKRFVSLKRNLLAGVAIITFAYCTAISFLVVRQRSYIYRPGTIGAATPADYAVPFEKLRIPNGRGGELAAWWLRHDDSEIRPTLVYCHGNSANLSLLAEVSSIFYGWGWNALLFDYTGYGASSPASDGFSEDYLLQDAQRAYDWAKSRGLESQILIWGHSLGSSVAARLAAQNHPAGLILEGAFPSIVTVARQRYPWALIFPFMLLDRFDTATYVLKRNFPLLVIHAELDGVIPAAFGRQVFDAASEPKQWLLVPSIGHKDFPSVARNYADFFRKLGISWLALRSSLKRE